MKLLGILDAPEKCTHVQVHTVTNTGGLGPRLKFEITTQDGQKHMADTLPIEQVTRDWLLDYIQPGPYRFGWFFVDAQGGKIRLAPASGAVQLLPRKEREVKKKDDAPVPMPTALPGGGVDPFALMAFMMDANDRADRRAREFYAVQTERDRAFYQSITARAPAAAAGGDDDDDEDEDDEEEGLADSAIRVLKAMGEEVRPVIEQLAKRGAKKAVETAADS